MKDLKCAMEALSSAVEVGVSSGRQRKWVSGGLCEAWCLFRATMSLLAMLTVLPVLVLVPMPVMLKALVVVFT